jgi:hypothetical protein
MKKIILFVVAILLLSLVSASDEITLSGDSMFSFSDSISTHQKAQTVGELKQMMLENENQNKINQAVYSLLSMESLLPAVGILVSDIAQQLNASSQKTTSIEENILLRSSFARFLVGGDFNLADEIESEIILNKERVSILRELNLRSRGSQEVQNIFEEQVKIIESEQTRLQEIVNSEKSSKGLFGWIWK